MQDDSLLSAGPNSVLTLDRYAFDTTTSKGQFDTSCAKSRRHLREDRQSRRTR
jgi:hypothetical protein